MAVAGRRHGRLLVVTGLIAATLVAMPGCGWTDDDCWPSLRELEARLSLALDPNLARGSIDDSRQALRATLNRCYDTTPFVETTDPPPDPEVYLTLLDLAIMADDTEIVRAALGVRAATDVDHGADLERTIGDRHTPLLLARQWGDLSKVQCLLALGAKVPAESDLVDVQNPLAQ